MERLDFVIPAYGEAPFLEATLESVLNQRVLGRTWLRWVKRPQTRECVLPSSVSVSETTQGAGIGGDWEAALGLAAEGEARLVCIAHADDIYSPRYAEEVLRAAALYPAAGIFFTDCEYLHSGFRHRLLNWFKRRINPVTRWGLTGSASGPILIPAAKISKALRWGCFIVCPAVTYRIAKVREALPDGRLFSRELKTALDWLAWIELSQRGIDFVYIPQALVKLRVHEGATTQDTLRTGTRSQEESLILRLNWGPRSARWVAFALRGAQLLQQLSQRRKVK